MNRKREHKACQLGIVPCALHVHDADGYLFSKWNNTDKWINILVLSQVHREKRLYADWEENEKREAWGK